MAATFVDLGTGRALRVCGAGVIEAAARELYPEIADKNKQQMKAYREMGDGELFGEQWVEVEVGRRRCRGYKGERSGVRGVRGGDQLRALRGEGSERLCLACAHPEQRYYRPASGETVREAVSDSGSRCECG